MLQTAFIAKHFRDVFLGGNWTSVNLKETLAGITWQQSVMKKGSLNTIAALVFHIHYYVHAILQVMKNKPLEAHDKYSFDVPAINSEKEWNKLLDTMWKEVDELAELISQMPAELLDGNFSGEKYGSYNRNLHGLIEHTHYHLGQIVIIRKLLAESQA